MNADPDRIVLGPPRRSFASSNARTLGKGSQESPDDAQASFKGGAFDKFKNGDSLDTKRSTHANGRHSSRIEQDSLDEKPRRNIEDDDDPRPRRDYDRKPKWAGDDETSHRSKFEQPWFRHDRGGDSLDDTKKDGKHSDWRRDRGGNRPWERSAPAEEDPEWMDEPMEEQATPARTQEDFQRWKERMKAGKNASANNEEAFITPSSPEPTAGRSQKAAAAFLDAEGDDSMDKFFARFNEAKISTEPTATVKAPTKTRFASLFSPLAEQPPQLPQVSQSPAPVPEMAMRETKPATPLETPNPEADQAGFARILQMLGGRTQNAAAPSPQDSRSRVPLYARDGQHKAEAERPAAPPGLMGLLGPRPPPGETQSPGQHMVDRLQESRSPNDQGHGRQQSNKDELLLNLLRQANQAPKPTPGPHLQDQYGGRGMFMTEDALNRSAMARNQMISPPQLGDPSFMYRRENGPYDEPPQQSMRYQEDLTSQEHLTRRSTNEGRGPSYDDQAVLNYLRAQGIQQQRSNQPNQQQPQGPPPGLARPPGLDQMARGPPGWPNQQPQPQPQQQRQAAPPGMPNLPRNIPAQFAGPNMQPNQPPNQRLQQSQPPPPPQQRKYTGESGLPNFPQMPPPGFMSNGPPPGFPGAGYGRYQGPPDPPQGLGRAFMDMYGDGSRAGVRGGTGGGMPGYR